MVEHSLAVLDKDLADRVALVTDLATGPVLEEQVVMQGSGFGGKLGLRK